MLVYDRGDLTVATVEAGRIRLDGGAMFGVVPKPLWERRIEPDDRNRIPMSMRCLLIRKGPRTILVDAGLGNKEADDEKFRSIYGVENEGDPTRLEDGLRAWGVEPEDVDTVVCTHLHFDHAGGCTVRGDDGEVRPAFPNARHVVRRGEWEFAHRDNERIRASYRRKDLDPLEEAGVLDLVEGDTEVAPGVRTVHTPGHTPHHQSVRIDAGSDTLLYLADLVPTRAHIPLPWIMGYDLEPLVTLETKRDLLGRAGREEWVLIFEHDPEVAYGWARPRDGEGCELASPAEEEGPPDPDDRPSGDGAETAPGPGAPGAGGPELDDPNETTGDTR